MSAPQKFSEFPSTAMPLATADMIRKPRFLKPTAYVHDYINLGSVQKCLEDRRSDFVTVNSTTFSAELELESRPHERFFVLERDHFTLFSHSHTPVKFSYKSRNAVIYLIDDNTIHEYYESTATVDMAELATVAQGKADLCVSHFFVVNRGKEYWAVDTKDPSISYAFGPSTKTRTISRLANGSIAVRALIDEELSQISIDAHTSQITEFKLRDINGEEVAEGDHFVLQIPDRSDDEDEDEDIRERRTMFDNKDWVTIFNRSHFNFGSEVMFTGTMDYGFSFGIAVVDGITYLTFEGQFVQINDYGRIPDIVVLPETPSKHNRIHLTYSDDGFTALSIWGAKVPIIFEWMKATCGVFYIDEGASIDGSAKLRIIKV
ncbi:hypothetical protein GGH93_003323 [Coemansia aciculifera]|nr:hypothetical protein GGH93_003323 [Coemansia aciculifera]